MKRIYGMTLFATLAVAPLALEAQTPGAATQDRGARGGQPFGMMLNQRAELGLSAEQVARLEAIGQRLQAQNAPLMEQLRASGAWQERKGTAREGRGAQMTPEQRQQMRERMQNATPEQRAAMRAEMQERHRNMTPEQREAMRAQMQERRSQAQGERGARQVPEELRPVMEQLRANRQAAMQEARAVLTTEQQTRLRELAQQRRGSGERMNRRPATR